MFRSSAVSSLLLTTVVTLGTLCSFSIAQATNKSVDFNRDVRAILSKNCFACHGADQESREAGLRLDLRSEAIKKLESQARAIVPGNVKQSELLRRISSSDESERMPPEDSGKKLTPKEIAVLKKWIEEGAEYKQHWSFVKPFRFPLPAVKNKSWPRNGIDYFTLARMERQGLKPSPEANRYALVRRLSIDLRGLPPTPNEVKQFVNDKSSKAYEKLVDRFLADSAYGERWARIWLDLARYADSTGYASDQLRIIWRYRDWVIDAFNKNMPYDQFTTEQLAGDLLPKATLDQKIATAFHRNTMTNTEGGTDDEEFRVAAVKDRVDTTMQVWMGLTFGCAKCHSHKYDPITQKEYYRFYDFFNQTTDRDLPNESPVIAAPTAEYRRKLKLYENRLAMFQRSVKSPKKLDKKKLAQLKKSKPKPPTVPVMQQLPQNKQRETFVMIKGNYLPSSRGDKVTAQVPAAFHPFPQNAPHNRLGLAKWIVDKNNPLTARVAVNRIWARLFGRGIVPTEEDFGTQGEPPSHPQLLDWLAIEFMSPSLNQADGHKPRDWDMKAMLRLIVASATYRQSSQTTVAQQKLDPENRFLSRSPRIRLEAEMVRDQALQLAGLLNRKIHGPSVFPPQPPGLWRAAFNGADRKWPTSKGADRYRRGIYTFWRRTSPYPSMTTFDVPSREVCSIRRIPTNTPLQAFVTLNDPVFVEAAQALGRRILKQGGNTTTTRVTFGLKLCLVRPPLQKQIDNLTALHKKLIEYYRKNKKEALEMATIPLGPLPKNISPAEAAVWTVISNVLLNLDGVLMRG